MMTEQEKQLLLKDLCARLPYDVNVKGNYDVFDDNGNVVKMDATGRVMWISKEYATIGFEGIYYSINCRIDTVKPYLHPMSSMTEEELNECVCQSGIKDIECPNWQDIPKEKQFEARLNHAIAVFLTDSNNVDWLNAHHFDYRGLIKKGLALEAPEGMYKI